MDNLLDLIATLFILKINSMARERVNRFHRHPSWVASLFTLIYQDTRPLYEICLPVLTLTYGETDGRSEGFMDEGVVKTLRGCIQRIKLLKVEKIDYYDYDGT